MKKKLFLNMVWVLSCLCFLPLGATQTSKSCFNKENKHDKRKDCKRDICDKKLEGVLRCLIKEEFKKLECILHKLKKCCCKDQKHHPNLDCGKHDHHSHHAHHDHGCRPC